jgi:hypothetical protein
MMRDCIILLDDTNYITTSCNYHPTFWNGIMIVQRVA